MNRKVSARSPSGNRTRRFWRRRIGEVVGSTAADCAAVWCCFPCAAMNLLVLALYKLPAGLYRRACARRRLNKRSTCKAAKRQRSDGLILHRRPSATSRCGLGPTIEELERQRMAEIEAVAAVAGVEEDDDVWAQFYGAGFWRSPSQKECRS